MVLMRSDIMKYEIAKKIESDGSLLQATRRRALQRQLKKIQAIHQGDFEIDNLFSKIVSNAINIVIVIINVIE